MNRHYCLTFNISRNPISGKPPKIDYGLVPTVNDNGVWKSEVSNEIFEPNQQTKNGPIRFFKTKEQAFFQLITEGNDDMEIAEKEILLLSEKLLLRRIPFRFRYRKALRKRVKRILSP